MPLCVSRLLHAHEPPVGETPGDPDGPLRAELRAFARAHDRWGHRRALVARRAAGFSLRELEKENSTLKRLLADAELDKAALTEIARGNF